MRYISYIEILTADFKTPVESMAPSLLTGILIMGIIWLVYRFSHIKILDRFVCSKKIMLVWLLFISYVIVVIETAFFFERAGQQKTGESEVIRNMGKYISDACLFSGKYHYVYSARDFAACSFPAYEKDEILCRNRLLLLLFDRSGTVYHAKGIFAG